MLRGISTLQGLTVAATDGEIGSVYDVYFDAKQWTVRYFVVDTGTWLSGRRVLVSPMAFRTPADVVGVGVQHPGDQRGRDPVRGRPHDQRPPQPDRVLTPDAPHDPQQLPILALAEGTHHHRPGHRTRLDPGRAPYKIKCCAPGHRMHAPTTACRQIEPGSLHRPTH
jgi:sporulation protein YlmC with PRC-barrel domain